MRDAAAHLDALVALLAEGEALWRPRPFTTTAPPWAEHHPELAAFCLGLSDDALHALEEGAPLPADAPPLLVSWVARLAEATALPEPAPTRPRDAWLVPARKLAQIDALARAVGPIAPPPALILDWCGGKGHLGRALGAALRTPVLVLERHAAYADEALDLARRASVDLTFEARDALANDTASWTRSLPADTLALGLHACGDLGQRLVELTVERGFTRLAHVPCCLHKIPGLKGGGHYLPLSQAARALFAAHGLRLDHSALRLATSDETIARPALRAQRSRDNAYRLALDLLVQDALGTQVYTPLGTLPPELTRADFATFARGAASRLGLPLPPFDPDLALARGQSRARQARRLGLVRSLFRRAIELVVALDRAAFLVEHGRPARVLAFAPRAATPRNLLILV